MSVFETSRVLYGAAGQALMFGMDCFGVASKLRAVQLLMSIPRTQEQMEFNLRVALQRRAVYQIAIKQLGGQRSVAREQGCENCESHDGHCDSRHNAVHTIGLYTS